MMSSLGAIDPASEIAKAFKAAVRAPDVTNTPLEQNKPSLQIGGSSIRKRWIMANLLWTVVVVLFVLWLLGFLLHFGGGLIHIALVVAVILVVFNLVTKGKATL